MTKPKHVIQQRGHRQPVGGKTYAPTSEVCRRYDVSEGTLKRWRDDPDTAFQISEGGANLYDTTELDEFDRRRAEQARARRDQRVATAVERHNQRQQADEAAKLQAAEEAARAGRRIKLQRGPQAAKPAGFRRGARAEKAPA